MSVTTSTPQVICNSPHNLSKSKMLWSIPRAPRMGIANKSLCGPAFYDLPEVRANRSTGFGYGKKSDFTRTCGNSPSPDAYAIKSSFDVPKKSGYSFGLSRELMPVSGGATVGEKRSPGPAAYDTRETKKTSMSFSFRPKTETVEDLQIKKMAVPGPGAYSAIETISPKGKLFVGKYQSASTTVFAPAHSKRFTETKEAKKPGPGAYDVGGDLNTSGSYFVSKFKSSVGKSFGLPLKTQSSSEVFKDSIPGPGSYKFPSDFGHYESKSISKVQHTVV